jgi:predicted ATPase
MRFGELDVAAMRQAAQPGQTVLSDRVLHQICQEPQSKQTLITWIPALTAMAIADITFPPDQIGRVLVTLVEHNGQAIFAYSASDGTLRLLAYLVAVLSPARAGLGFFEEIETGIHPTQIHLVLDLLERTATQQGMQVVVTTHAPQSLRCGSPTGLAHIALTYRLEGQADTRIRRIVDLPNDRHIIQEQDIANVYETRWFEDSADVCCT